MDDMDAIYRSHAQTVYKFLLAQCRDPDLAEELTQETFYRAVCSIDRFDGSCKLSVWLCQIAKHLWYQHLRKHRREAPLAEELGGRCAWVAGLSAGVCVAGNLLQFLLLPVLHSARFNVSLPFAAILLAASLGLLCRYFRRAKAVSDDNGTII